MSKTIYLLLFVSFTFFSIQSWRNSTRDHEVKEEGATVHASIVERPRYSSGTASMMVSLDGKRYRLEIGSNYCSENNCKVGSKVKVIYNSAHDRMVLSSDNTTAGLYLSGVLSLFPLYCLYMLLRK
jgi:hypothetical protein